VAVFGGGIAGLTAAHELAERGFDVTVLERRAWGGKSRSTHLSHSGFGGRMPLPGEHGYRYEFGCYQNLPDTMRRIPFGSSRNGVFGNRVEIPQVLFARTKKRDLMVPTGPHAAEAYTPQQVVDLLVGVLVDLELRPDAIAYFANRMVVFFSSCDARRLGQWERTSWLDFVAADRYGDDYLKIVGRLPELLWSFKAPETSAKLIAWFVEIWFLYGLLGRGTIGPAFGVLNGPTSDVWIDPWVAELERLGVRMRLKHEVTGLEAVGGRVAGAHVRAPHGRRRVVADWYVCALPVERARRLWTRAILKADPRLAGMNKFATAPMLGISFHIRSRSQIAEGTVSCTDAPWSVSFLPQAQFWTGDFAVRYGDGTVHDKISALMSTWDVAGVLYGKPARDCTPNEIAREIWAQIKQHINKPGQTPKLTDQMLHSWQIDPGVLVRRDRVIEQDPLVIATVGTARYRPDVTTGIPNLTLAGDYLNGAWEVANMEAANYNARRAANAILSNSGSRETPATTVPPYQPPEWEPLRKLDELRYAQGQPNLFDADMTLDQLKNLLASISERLLGIPLP
jgi:uncharacterized protein with NAD-binding domain and iron-sulfur cluster